MGQGVIYMQVQVPDMFGSELAAALDFDGGANNLINLIQNNLIKVMLKSLVRACSNCAVHKCKYPTR